MYTHYYTNVLYRKFSMHPGEGAAITVTYFPAIESRRVYKPVSWNTRKFRELEHT
jgi:hypothetical protein